MQLILRKIVKLINLTITIIMILLVSIQSVSLAAGTIPTNGIKPTDDQQFFQIAGVILGIIQVIGTAVGVIVVAIIGIKYLISSVEERAEYKQTLIYYIIGAVLLIASVNITSIVYSIFNN